MEKKFLPYLNFSRQDAKDTKKKAFLDITTVLFYQFTQFFFCCNASGTSLKWAKKLGASIIITGDIAVLL